MENENSCLTCDEWFEILELEPCFDRKDVAIDKDKLSFYFIQCLDEVVMIRKEYWNLLVEENVSRETKVL